jgi:4-hydroxy-4-methyl-2-oxoglutarate aldolase
LLSALPGGAIRHAKYLYRASIQTMPSPTISTDDLAETRQRLLALSSGLLSDALGKTSAMDHDMHCRSAQCRMAGPAVTLRVHTADILMVGKGVAVCPPGHVLVIDGQGELNTALWGGIITIAARLKGLAGVVIDGAIRDSAEISQDALPVFARAVVPNAGGAEYPGELQIPVQCGGMVVHPGDWIVGDEDGVTVVPAGRLEEALEKAELLLEVEKKIYAQVAAGKDLAELLRYDEALERKARDSMLPQLRFTGK